jgi:hypothetical protein
MKAFQLYSDNITRDNSVSMGDEILRKWNIYFNFIFKIFGADI